MSTFVPNKVYLRGILLDYFIQNKSAAEEHRILVETYGDNADGYDMQRLVSTLQK